MHDVLIVSVPLITILAGLFFNNSAIKGLRGEIRGVRGEIKDLRGEIKDLRWEMNRRFDEVDADLRYFRGVTGELRGCIDTIEKRH